MHGLPNLKTNKTCWTVFTVVLVIPKRWRINTKPLDFIFRDTVSFTAQFRQFRRIPQFILEVRNTAAVTAVSVSPGGRCLLVVHLCAWYVEPFVCGWKMPTVIVWHYVRYRIILFVAPSCLFSESYLFQIYAYHTVNIVENERSDDQEGDGSVSLKMNYKEEGCEDGK